MNRMTKTILGLVFLAVMTLSAVVIVSKVTGTAKMDITQEKLYTLSDGTKSILKRITQPVTVKLFYAKTATTKALDDIKSYNDYYYYVKALLEEYASCNNNIKLDIIDPRPYSEDEEEALRYGLKRFPVTQEEGFFFGLVAKTEYGATKSIEFFAPDRQNLIEYDISYLLDTLTTRQKSKVGVLSSLEVMGEDMSPYMMQMMQQTGQRPKQPWIITQHLGQKYEFEKIPTDIDSIEGVDMLMVIHPKNLSEQTLFAIDQYVLNGGRAVFMVDPYCLSDQPDSQMQMYGQQNPDQSSSINTLLNAWGVDVPEHAMAGDKTLAETVQLSRNGYPEKLVTYLDFSEEHKSFNKDSVISSDLADVKMLFTGSLKPVDGMEDQTAILPLIQTTAEGNTFEPDQMSLRRLNPKALMSDFAAGSKPIVTAALVTGKFKSAFPNGITKPAENSDSESADIDKSDELEKAPEVVTGIIEAQQDCTIAVFTDVDFISDSFAYNVTPFGASPNGDNASFMMNAVDNLLGSDELIAIRCRGNFRRPFTLIDKIEAEAESRSEEQVKAIQADIDGFQQQLNEVLNNAKGQGQLVIDASQFDSASKVLELKIVESKKKLRDAQLARREGIEAIGDKLTIFNTAGAPAVILMIAIVLTVQRSAKRRKYLAEKNK